jgi:hypothetical protein
MVKDMATKLTSSLRKSISAEQKSVEDKEISVTKSAAKKAAPKKPAAVTQTAAKPVAETAVKTKATPIVKNTQPKVEEAKPIAFEKVAPAVKTAPAIPEIFKIESNALNIFKKLQPNFPGFDIALTGQYAQGVDVFKETIDKLTDANHELLSACLDNLLEVNDDVSDYIKKIMKTDNLANIYQLNSEFITTLRKRQQEMIAKNMQIFGQFKGFKLPFVK